MKHLLTIAGSDSSGGAGIQADLKTFAAHGTFGMSVITAVTAQNTQGVTMVQDIDAGVIEAQIDAVFDDIRVDAVKIGMVSRPEIIKTIADRLRYYKPQIVVLDPVMISKSGYPLLAPEACATLVQELLPLATLVTPNLPEAEVISGMKVTMKEEMRPVAERILELGAKAVLVKGGHLNGSADDLLFDGSTVYGRSHRHKKYAWYRLHIIQFAGGKPCPGSEPGGCRCGFEGLCNRSDRIQFADRRRLWPDTSFC